jgi:uncharacterized protein YrrD
VTERFTNAVGRKLISRATAEELGNLSHLVVDVGRRAVSGLVVGKGRRAQVVDWEHLTGFGPDAIMLGDDASLHLPVDDYERAAAHGERDLLGRRTLSELGNEVGTIDDVTFDAETGELLSIVIGSREHPAADLLGAGSYAVVLSASVETPATGA